VAEVGGAEAEAGGGVRAESVAGFQDGQGAAGADQGGSGAQQFVEGVGQGGGADQAFGEFVQRRQVGDPAGQSVLQDLARCVLGVRRGGGGRCDLGDTGVARGVGGGCGRAGRCGNCLIASGHFLRVRGVHGVRLSDRCVLLKSIANPHVVLRR
jgi:hypothetical protein